MAPGILSALFPRGQTRSETRGVSINDAFIRSHRDTALAVNATQALSIPAVFACVRVLSESIASLPLLLYRRTDGGRERAGDHPLYTVLHKLANPDHASVEFRELLMAYLLLWGNAFAEIRRNGAGQVVELWPLLPWKMTVRSRPEGITYIYDGREAPYTREQIMHIRGLGINTVTGISVVAQHRQAMAISSAAASYGEHFFANNARPNGVLKTPNALTKEARDNLRASWSEAYAGPNNTGRTAVLEEGLEYQGISLPPEDVQFLQTRQFQVVEIARVFRVPPHMIADLTQATYSNIEHQGIEFLNYSLRPWLVRIEQAIYRDLLTPAERQIYYAEHMVDGLLRTDIDTRYRSYATGRQNGWLSANDIRQMENMPLIDGGDVYLTPLNMVPSDQAGEQQGDDGVPIVRRSLETRASPPQMALKRKQLSTAQRAVLADAMGVVLRREANDISNALQRHGGQWSAEFGKWLEEFYTGHKQFMVRKLLPTFQTFAALVRDLVAEEIDHRAEYDLDGFITVYLLGLANRHIGKSQLHLQNAVTSEDPETAASDLFTKWRDERPVSAARGESTQFSNAIAKALYVTAGIGTLTWHEVGDSCPYCTALNGRQIPIDSYFVSQGEDWQPEGAEVPLNPSSNIGHPPAHDGCDCVTLAGVQL